MILKAAFEGNAMESISVCQLDSSTAEGHYKRSNASRSPYTLNFDKSHRAK